MHIIHCKATTVEIAGEMVPVDLWVGRATDNRRIYRVTRRGADNTPVKPTTLLHRSQLGALNSFKANHATEGR